MSGTLRRARVFDLAAGPGTNVEAVAEIDAPDLGLGYRRSSVGAGQVVVAAEFELAIGDRATAEAELAPSPAGGGRTSPAGPTPVRCSPTRPATRPGG